MNGRKTYYSFHDIPLKDRENYDSGIQLSGIKFSRPEIFHILIAMAVLTIAFSFAFAPYPPLTHVAEVIGYLPLSFLAIVTAFFCHEIAHKYVGQKFGYWSEFRMYPRGLLFALFLAILAGIVFAAPGAVVSSAKHFFSQPNTKQLTIISMAGVSFNITLMWISIALYALSGMSILSFVASINGWFAIFNLIPFGMLDGQKLFKLNINNCVY